MDNKVLDEAVETYLQVECQAINGDDTEYLHCSDRDREIVRAALLAAMPVLLGPKIATVHEGDYMTRAVVWHEAAGDLEHGAHDLYAPDLGGGK